MAPTDFIHHRQKYIQPALGAVFSQLLAEGNYTHWGYGDMDMLVGRLFVPTAGPAAATARAVAGEGADASSDTVSAGAAAHPFAAAARDLDAYDALTFSFGDQFRGYLRCAYIYIHIYIHEVVYI